MCTMKSAGMQLVGLGFFGCAVAQDLFLARKPQCTPHQGTDVAVYHYKKFAASSVDDCCAACSADSKCKVAVFHVDHCSLKDSVKLVQSSSDFVTVFPAATPEPIPTPAPPQPQCASRQGMDVAVTHYRQFAASSPDECCTACSADSRCKVAVFHRDHCNLKDSVKLVPSRSDFVSMLPSGTPWPAPTPSPRPPAPTPPVPTPPGPIDDQPESSVKLINESKDKLTVYCQNQRAPANNWAMLSGQGTLDPPVEFGPNGDQPANDVGASTWQLAHLAPGESMILQIPDFHHGQAWSLRPLKYINGRPCSGGGGDCGMPILIESGKDMVGDMSAVDGVNYNLKYEMTSKGGTTTIDFKGNPCRAVGARSSKGCRNPQIDFGDWMKAPCPAGTCNLKGNFKRWCDAIHLGQCANSSSTWENRGYGSKDCARKNRFTTYCYSHDDANSSPYFGWPYKMRLTYKDLD